MWRKQLLSTLIIFLLGVFVQYWIQCKECLKEWDVPMEGLLFAGMLWVLLWKGSEFWAELLNRYSVSWIKKPLLRFIYSFLTVTIYAALAYVFTFLFVFVLVMDRTMDEALQHIGLQGIVITTVVTLVINIIMHGQAFLANWRQNAIDNERLKTEHIASQLISLKDQVNPHFLFNSLNALSSLVYEDQKKAVKFIRKLSEVYRYVLDQTDKELVTLEDELRFLESYVYLLKIRFDDNLHVHTSAISDRLKQKWIPPMSLQLLVENAIKHNVVSSQKPLTIELTARQDAVEGLVVRNNVIPKKAVESNGIGLQNLRKRYQFLSDQQIIINNTSKVFEVFLPLLDFQS